MSNIAAKQLVSKGLRFIEKPVGMMTEQLVESSATALLNSHPHFRGQDHWVQFRCFDGCLYLSGKLPSYYLKQLAQEAVRDLHGFERIENQIDVASPVGEIRTCTLPMAPNWIDTFESRLR